MEPTSTSKRMPIVFVMHEPASNRTVREKFLSNSEARSHAARFTHWQKAVKSQSKRRSWVSNHAATQLDDVSDNRYRVRRPPIQDILSQNKRDPFFQWSASRHPAFFQELVEYGYDVLLPRFINHGETEDIHPARREWRFAAQEDPAIDHVHLATIADFGKVIYRGNDAIIDILERIRLHHHTQALSLVRKAVNKMHVNCLPTDGLILAVLNLAFLDGSWDDRQQPKYPALSPAIKGLFFAGHTRKTSSNAHAHALKTLVRAKGGLEEIKLAGIAEFVSLWDLRCSTAENRAPDIPILKAHQHGLARYDVTTQNLSQLNPYAELGNGFQILPDEFDATRMLQEILVRTAAITREFCSLASNVKKTPESHALVKIAWITHHQLLSLPAKANTENDPNGKIINFIYAVTRAAAMIYHSTVTCPVATNIDNKLQLAQQLHEALLEPWPELVSQDGDVDHRHLMLWVLLMGSIGATFSKHRKWFVTQLRERSRQSGLDSFSAFKTRMLTFLWVDNMDEPAFKAWLEGEVDNFFGERGQLPEWASGLKHPAYC